MAIRPLSSNLNQTSFVNRGFIIWLSGHYPAILTKQALSIKDLLYGYQATIQQSQPNKLGQ